MGSIPRVVMGGAWQEALDFQATTSLLSAVPLPAPTYLGLRCLTGTMRFRIPQAGLLHPSTCHGLGPYIYGII